MAKTWFITGASSGFGHEWTQAALERGDRVAATARNVGSLDSLAEKYGDAVLPLRLDVTNRSNVFETVQRAAEHFGSLDVVINSAGYGQFGMVEELSEDDIRAQLETNFFGALWVTQAALPIMRKQHSGRILQVTSEGGVRAWPGIGAYHASKWALEGLSQSLSQEVKQFGIHVTVVEPGPYATGFAASHRNSKENPDYKIVRDGIDYNWQFGILSATRRAILKVVDAEQPPLRILLGKSLEPLTAEYEQRLATWNKWQSVSLEAFGA